MGNIEARFHIDWPGFTLNIELSLPGRGVIALFGPSGSGKTTLLRCIAGLERAANGFLAVNGEVWQDHQSWLPTHQRPLGYVFQEASLFSHLSVLKNLQYGLKRCSKVKQDSLDQAIELLGISHLLNRKPDLLSGGERQRVSIARALAVNPRILLMDEPLAALDLTRKQEILPYLERLHDQLEIPLLYVSHSSEEVAWLADYLVALDKGQVRGHGPLGEMLVRVDMPIKLGKDVGAVLDAKVGAIDKVWHLARVDFLGGSLWTGDHGIPIGNKIRVRVLARDVSLALEKSLQSSVQNQLQGRVDAIAADEHPALALVRVRVGDSAFVARLTKRAIAELNIVLGQELWVQVKSIALLD